MEDGLTVPRDLKVHVVNVVASVHLGLKIDLESIASTLVGASYEPEQFPGLVYRLDEPKAAALIFSTGKIICTGARSIELMQLAVEKILEKLRSAGVEIAATSPKVVVQNIVATAALGGELNLDAIAVSLDNVEYEPEQFPGLVYRMSDPKVVLLLFGSGKIVITGGKSMSDVRGAAANIDKELKDLGLLAHL